jgi:hypothetical protein
VSGSSWLPFGGDAPGLTGLDIRFVNPEALSPSLGYTYLVDANRPGRILDLAGQLGTDTTGKVVSAEISIVVLAGGAALLTAGDSPSESKSLIRCYLVV